MTNLTLIFAFCTLLAFVCTLSGLLAFSRKMYDNSFVMFTAALISVMLLSFPDFLSGIDNRFTDLPTWIKVCDITACVILYTFITIACFKHSPQSKEISKAKLETAGAMGTYMRPYYHQMMRVIWKIRKQDAYDSARLYRCQRVELEIMIDHAKTDMDRDSYKERLALVTEQERRWTKCCNKINLYDKKIQSKYSDPAPTILLDP